MNDLYKQYVGSVKIVNMITPMWLEIMKEPPRVMAADTETTSLYFHTQSWLHRDIGDILVNQPFPFGISLAFYWKKKLVLVWARHQTKLYKDIIDLLRSNNTKIWHNARYDLRVLKELGVIVGGEQHDTLTMSRIFWDRRRKHDLQSLSEITCPELSDWKIVTDKEMTKLKRKYRKMGYPEGYVNYSFIPDDIMSVYSPKDTFMTLMLYKRMGGIIDENFKELYRREMEVLYVIMKIEERGLRYDYEKSDRLIRKYRKEIEKCDDILTDIGGAEFNCDSPLQVKQVLKQLGVSSKDLTVKGKETTGADKLKELLSSLFSSSDNPSRSDSDSSAKTRMADFIQALLLHRAMSKTVSTYLSPLSTQAKQNDGIVYTTINPNDTITGRMASRDPNLQNIPSLHPKSSEKTDEENPVRSCFVCREGYTNYYFDYSAMEMAVFGLYTNDEYILSTYREGGDIHGAMAARLFGKDYDDIDRARTKSINFGCLSLDTPILTEHGWKKLREVDRYERVWNGSSFVRHSGLVSKGKKLCVKENGIWLTPEHEILTSEGWTTVAELNINNRQSELCLDSSQLQRLQLANVAELSPFNAIVPAVQHAVLLGIISLPEKLQDAFLVGLKLSLKRKLNTISFQRNTETGYKTLFTMRLDDAIGGHTVIMENEGYRFVRNGLTIEPNLLNISLHYQTGITQNFSWTELITMGTTNLETLGLSLPQRVLETGDLVNVEAGHCYQAGNNIVANCIYGMGIKRLAVNLNITLREAKEFSRMYHETFPTIREFMDRCEYELKQLGYVEDYFGKRYSIPVGQAYKAVNALIQGTCASVFKTALLATDEHVVNERCKILLPVHDEIQMERKNPETGERRFVESVIECMVEVPEILSRGLMLRVECSRSRTNWAEKEKLKF